jgi:hypothetical protein
MVKRKRTHNTMVKRKRTHNTMVFRPLYCVSFFF